MKRNKNSLLVFIILVILTYGILQVFGITCPIKFITGVSCPGCGMTRAYLSLLRLDFKSAYYYHPLFVLPALGLIIYIFRDKFSKKFLRRLEIFFVLVFLIVYVFRMMDPKDTIVIFRPYESIFYKIFNFLKELMR
ncbi:DUF2752 domain-containing protein [Peptoniphilus harei]|uniref:DUF2752 domain-containing protein n=1 Tax=Peptoniphilus harei TaxID=54005 RepID=UPI002549EF85|nr:DUF2752 domain-containing protein [Peptoniphilus harei]MDK7354360.1 DUF2752 domain-containing protein [Peptoniphilus harei]MDK7370011.1 DUF2752 domain-containing protein [Peptoniphilus harei]